MIILGIGCNIGDRLANLRAALEHLRAISGVTIQQVSPIYESDALLPDNAPVEWDTPYLNLAVSITSALTPEQLITHTKAIEITMGRSQHLHWSPRIIDIDILTWQQEYINTNTINIPHKGLIERPFTLWPLADLAPDWCYCKPNQPDTGKTAGQLAAKLGSRFTGEAPLHTKQIAHRIDTPLMMGIVNLTPDSFSDGGAALDPQCALTQATALFDAGADIIDIGAESTRPHASVVTPAQEWQRLESFLYLWQHVWRHKTCCPKISVDTYRAETVIKLLDYPIDFINDVTGFTNPAMIELAQQTQAKLIFMHNLGVPVNPSVTLPQDIDPTEAVYRWGSQQLERLLKAGIAPERLIFDVGIGFGKTSDQSWAIIKNITKFHSLGVPILVGHSRKSFLQQFTHQPSAERDLETASISTYLADKVAYLRVHNIAANMRLLKIRVALQT